MTNDELTAQERDLLEFAKLRWRYLGAFESAVRQRLDMTVTRYYQVLGALMEDPRAEAAEPQLIRRLRSLRDRRRQQRSWARVGRPVD